MFTRIFLSSALACLALAACSDPKPNSNAAASQPQSTPANNTQTQTVKIATEANFLPLRYRDGTHPQPLGFQIDVLKAVGDAAKLQFEYVLTPNAPKLNILGAQDDYVATLATFDKTPENEALADFTLPITTTKYVVHLKSDQNTTGSLNDLHGKTISIDAYYASNPKNMELLTQLTGSKDKIVVEKMLYPAWKNMITQKTDGVFGENLVLDYTLKTHKEDVDVKVKVVDLNLPPNERALLLKKGNPELLEKINQGINSIKATGTYQQLEHQWFANTK